MAKKRNPSVIFWAGWFPVCFFKDVHPKTLGEMIPFWLAHIFLEWVGSVQPPNSFFAQQIYFAGRSGLSICSWAVGARRPKLPCCRGIEIHSSVSPWNRARREWVTVGELGSLGAPLKKTNRRGWKMFFFWGGSWSVCASFISWWCALLFFNTFQYLFFADHDVFGAGAFNWINFQQKISQLFDHVNSVIGTSLKMNLNRWSLFTTWSNIHESNHLRNWSNIPLLANKIPWNQLYTWCSSQHRAISTGFWDDNMFTWQLIR